MFIPITVIVCHSHVVFDTWPITGLGLDGLTTYAFAYVFSLSWSYASVQLLGNGNWIMNTAFFIGFNTTSFLKISEIYTFVIRIIFIVVSSITFALVNYKF